MKKRILFLSIFLASITVNAQYDWMVKIYTKANQPASKPLPYYYISSDTLYVLADTTIDVTGVKNKVQFRQGIPLNQLYKVEHWRPEDYNYGKPIPWIAAIVGAVAGAATTPPKPKPVQSSGGGGGGIVSFGGGGSMMGDVPDFSFVPRCCVGLGVGLLTGIVIKGITNSAEQHMIINYQQKQLDKLSVKMDR